MRASRGATGSPGAAAQSAATVGSRGAAPQFGVAALRFRAYAGVAALLLAAGCGGPQRTGDSEPAAARPAGEPAPAAPTDTRTAIERRRDVACDQLGPKITACAIEDARADLAAGKIDQRQFDRDTAPAVQHKHTEEFEKACKSATYSSRQVRVLEVCFHDETRCGPLLDCLGHLNDRPPGGGK